MIEWQDMEQKPNTKLQDLLKNKKAKTRKLSEPSKTEQNRLAKLNAMLFELRRQKTRYANLEKIDTLCVSKKNRSNIHTITNLNRYFVHVRDRD